MTRLPDQHENEILDTKPSSFSKSQKRKITGFQTTLGFTRPNNMSSGKRFKFFGKQSSKQSSSESETPLIVGFYDPNIQAKDARGRTLEQILTWPDSELERCHNYIQMLFPVPEGSAFNWEAPIIDREVMDAFRARSELRSGLRTAFERMLEFYGFKFATSVEDTNGNDVQPEAGAVGDVESSDTPALSPDAQPHNAHAETNQIIRSPNFHSASRNWAVRFDHNHLRITRILRCLRILGLEAECDAFFSALRGVFDDPAYSISQRSMDYWQCAATRKLSIAPDDDRIEWLEAWEAEQSRQGAVGGAKDKSVEKED